MRYLILCLCLFSGSLYAADISVHADRDTLQLNESLQLLYEAKGSVDGDPDFSVLEQDFDILSKSRSSNFSVINGDFQRSVTWSLTVMPKQAGIITIPPVAFGKDQSPSLRLTIKPAGTSKGAHMADQSIELEVEPQSVYVNQQLIVTVRMFSNSNVLQYGIGDLEIEGVDADIEKLGDDRQYRSQRNGSTFLVLERSYTVFPQQAGELRIKPLLGEMQLSGGAGSNQFFDPFRQRGEVKRVRSSAQQVQVKAIPAPFNAGNWLPARELQLVEEWPDAKGGQPSFKVGEPVTRRLSLLADGIPAARLPELSGTASAGLKQYPEPPRLHDEKKSSGVIGIREQSVALIPTHPGRYTLPAIEIPWWNVQTGQREILRLAARDIQVGGSAATAPVPTGAVPQSIAPATSGNLPANGPDDSAAPAGNGNNGLWPLLTALFALAWLLTLLAWWWSHRRTSEARSSAAEPHHRDSPSRALKALRQACQSRSAADCQRALLDWGRSCLQQPGLNSLGELGRHCGEPLQSLLADLEAARYRDQSGSWDAEAILQHCRQYSCRTSPKNTADTGLEPLYKA